MVFAGLPLSTLLAIGGAFAAATVVLYVLKLRRRPLAVPFTRLWREVRSEKQSSSLFSQLKRLLSLLLSLLMVGALVLALGDPRPSGHRTEGRSFVVLVDTSASMGATDEKPSRLGAATGRLSEIIQGLSSADRMQIVSMGPTPRPLTTLTDDAAALQAATQSLRPSDTGADLDQALAFAQDALRGQPRPEVLVMSDGALGAGDAGEREAQKTELERAGIALSYFGVGKAARNVAITQFSVRRYPLDKSRYEVLLELTNASPEPATVELSLYGDGAIVEVTRLSLGPNERARRFYPDLAGANRDLEARIAVVDGAADTLPADNRAFATLPERRRARVLLVSAGNAYLEAAVLLDEYLVVEQIAPAQYPPAKDFDVTIFDGVAPPRVARTGAALYLGPPREASEAKNFPVKIGEELEMFGFDEWDEKSPVLRWMAMPDIQVLAGHALTPEKGDRVLGSSESESGVKRPILVSGTRAEGPFIALGFDPRRSDLVLRIGFPLFVLNVIDAFSSQSTDALSAFQTGSVWRVPLGARRVGAGPLWVQAPDGERVEAPVENESAVLFGERAGFYDVSGVEPPLRFAASLSDPEESHIEPKNEVLPGVRAGRGPELALGTRREWWGMLVLGVLLVSLVEWVTYHRRWTV
jgi:hypothetical protein